MDSDKHQLPETAEDAAPDAGAAATRLRSAAERIDKQPARLAAARRIRRRLRGDERFGDPLSTAGVTAPQVLARGVSALPPNRNRLVQELAPR